MIRDYLIPALKSAFAESEIIFDHPPRPIATFRANQSALGKILVFDDGDEATVLVEKITHGHFGSYDLSLKEEEKSKIITKNVVDFLNALFNDRVLLYSKGDNRAGGWTRLDLKEGPVELSPSFSYFLWSRSYTTRQND